MPSVHSIKTERLLLRRWREEDREPFAEMMADPEFNRYMPGPFDRAVSDGMFDRNQERIESTGIGDWVVELPGQADFIGSVGLAIPRTTLPFSPCVEIGWHLLPGFWNCGYASEGAQAALRHGFEELELDEIVSFTMPENLASRRVMEKIGMSRDLDGDFGLPDLWTAGHPLRPHVLYRMQRP